MLLLLWVVDHQVASNQAVVFVRLFHQLDFPVVAAPPGNKNNNVLLRLEEYSLSYSIFISRFCTRDLYVAGGLARALQFMEILPSGESSE